jgi:hypothetical protein
MRCKYCGKDMVMGRSCHGSPTKKCVGVADGIKCVYCNNRFAANGSCNNSPSKKHQLSS